MYDYDISNLTFAQVRIFLCTAECGSFSNAAKQLNYTQSMISKTIAGLERELGLILFLRQKNQNILTPAGKLLYEDWKNLFKWIENSIKKAHASQSGMSASLNMGVVHSMIYSDLLAEVVQNFTSEYPEIDFGYEEYPMSELLEQAKDQNLDIIVTAAFDEETLKNYGYSCQTLFHTKLTVFVPKTNPLFQKNTISFHDLQAEKFIVLSKASYPNYIPLLNQICNKYGFKPQISRQVSSAHSFKMNLLKGQGIVLADNYTRIEHEEIKGFELEDIGDDLYKGVIIAWNDKKPGAEKFVKSINQKII